MAFELTSLQAIETFVAANGRVFNYEEVEIVRLRVRDAREAITLLGPVRRSGLLVNNYDRADVLATAGLMLEAADMIIDDLLREVEERSVDIQHVRGLRSNGEFIRSRVNTDEFFGFVDEVAQQIVSVAREMQGPFRRNHAQMHRSLRTLRSSITSLRDRQVEFPRQAPHPGPVVIGLSLGPAVVDLSGGQPSAASAPPVVDAPDVSAPKEEAVLVDADGTLVADAAERKEEAPAPEEEALLVDAAARKEEVPALKEEETPALKEEEASEVKARVLLVDATSTLKEETVLVDLDAMATPAPEEEAPLVDSATPASTPKVDLDVTATPAPEEEEEAAEPEEEEAPLVDSATPASTPTVDLDATATPASTAATRTVARSA